MNAFKKGKEIHLQKRKLRSLDVEEAYVRTSRVVF